MREVPGICSCFVYPWFWVYRDGEYLPRSIRTMGLGYAREQVRRKTFQTRLFLPHRPDRLLVMNRIYLRALRNYQQMVIDYCELAKQGKIKTTTKQIETIKQMNAILFPDPSSSKTCTSA